MFYRQLRTFTIVYGSPVQQFILRIGLAVDQYGGYLDKMQALLMIAGETGSRDEDAIDTPTVESPDDRQFLVGIIVGGAEEHTETRCTRYFLDAFHNVTPEWIGY